MKRVRVIICRVGQLPTVALVDQDLKAFQAIVGGFIECVHVTNDGLDIWCNEEGRLLELPYNRAGICGDFFIARADADGEMADVTDADISAVRAEPHAAVM